jgi:hypothetical protein
MATKRNKAAVALSKLRMTKMTPEQRSAVASLGGKAAAKKVDPERKTAIAKAAVAARWAKKKAK